MKANFWHEKWNKDEIPFHEGETNLQLLAHFDKLALPKGSRVFLPLCGKTRDIAWLLNKGYRVVGAELSELAIKALFEGLGVEPDKSTVGELIHYRAQDIDIFVGDIFNVSAELLGSTDAIYDRAALVALPETMRDQYTAHLINVTNKAPQLLITYAYNQQLMDGPPFSISEEEVKRHYAEAYQVAIVDSLDVTGGLKGKVMSVETTWLLK
ncbi:thiopurine S-methyltransferase [Gammaproteobacteria bacterium 42_54_T18]|nr:thiopurine S-methyltransferase [Gammaproteobacteria bacterium 42_54_T18]